MKYGIRECCDVVMRAKADEQLIGDKLFYRDEPVCYFDTLKTSSLEGAATTVYAQGGRGNPRLMSWDGERTLTFTMEDALISPEGLAILAGAGLLNTRPESQPNAKDGISAFEHIVEKTVVKGGSDEGYKIQVSKKPYVGSAADDNVIYVMASDPNGNIASEPYLYQYDEEGSDPTNKKYVIKIRPADKKYHRPDYACAIEYEYVADDAAKDLKDGADVLVDYYTEHVEGWLIIDIEPDKFGGSFYLEASTLWRDQDGVDHAAEFIIPNCRVQSNFTFSMSGSGDPSTFTFTLDAFPGYTRFNPTKKVLAEILISGAATDNKMEVRRATDAGNTLGGGAGGNG